MEVYHHSSVQALLGAVGFGIGWGVGGIFFGLGLAALGLSLGLSLIMGLIAIGGSIIQLMMQHPEQISRLSGLVLMAGIAIMILGIAVRTKAGTAVYWLAAIVMGLLWAGGIVIYDWNDSVESLRRNSRVSCNAQQFDHHRGCPGVFDERMARHRISTQAHHGIRCVPTRDRNCGNRLLA
jgi:predicted membrane channel-forming protein YqfA (hemolysin III family)